MAAGAGPSPHLGNLVSLRLGNNRIGEVGAKDLAAFRNLKSLRQLRPVPQ